VRPRWHYVLFAGFAAWFVIAMIQWLVPAPLGHDEAQYAIAARDMLAGRDPRWFYLSQGMNALAVPGVLAGDSEIVLRIAPMLAGFAFIAIVALLARRVLSPITAAWGVAVLAGSRPLIQRSTELLSDMPSAACLLAACWVVVVELSRDDGPRWRFLVTAPLFAAAFYLRYGNSVAILVIGVAAVIVYGRGIVRGPGPVIAAAALFALLFVPHALSAHRLTGRVFGILLLGKQVPGGETGEGLVSYLTGSPWKYYGTLAPFVMIAGVLAIARFRERGVRFLWLVAVADIVATGLVAPAQPRYIFLGSTLLVLLGVDTLRRSIESLPDRSRDLLAALTATAIVFSWSITARQAARYPGGARTRLAGILDAADAIRRDAHGRRCWLLSQRTTQLEWYSGCEGAWYIPWDDVARGVPVYVVREDTGGEPPDFALPPGKHRQVLDTAHAHVIALER
jgi:hypothetical protein